MGVQNTFIPTRIDLGATDETYITVTDNERLTAGTQYFVDFADQQLSIMELMANAGSSAITPIPNDSVVADVFSDSTGYQNSVNTGSTTASFFSLTKSYSSASETVNNSVGLAFNASTSASTVKQGLKFVPTTTTAVASITKTSTSTCTTGYILDASQNVLASATFSGQVATFTSPVPVTSGVAYYAVGDSGGASWTKHKRDTTAFPFVSTDLNYTAVLISGSEFTNEICLVESLQTQEPSNVPREIVCDELGTIASGVTHVGLFVDAPNREAGDDITFDLTDGSTTLEDQPINTKIIWDGDAPTTLTINLVPKSVNPSTNTPNCRGYALALWREA